jgi:hypothetical protein
VSALTCLGRHTVTGLLCASGQLHQDWSAAYRLFEQARMDFGQVWRTVRKETLAGIPSEQPLVAGLDDTLLPKSGRKVTGAGWRRDPLGPRFQTNLIWAQRILQTTLLLPEGPGPARARAIPVDLVHAPTPRRPRPQAPAEAWEQYRQAQSAQKLSVVGRERIHALRTALDQEGQQGRPLVFAVDGGYTNRTVFREVPAGVTLLGRVRKDAALFASPVPQAKGRPRVYGTPLPTPEQMRQDPTLPWRTVSVYAAGKLQSMEVKVVQPVRWKGAGNQDLQLVIVRPLAYRPCRGSRLLYRQPAYLLCTDPQLSLETLLQAFVWRWEVEVTFREEKTLLGMGQAQVRTEPAVATAPAFTAAMYAFLHLAAARVASSQQPLARPRWQRPAPEARPTTGQLQGLLRADLWADTLGVTFEGFAAEPHPHPKPLKITSSPAAAVCYASG